MRQRQISLDELRQQIRDGRNIEASLISPYSGVPPRSLRAAVKRKEIDGIRVGNFTLLFPTEAARLIGMKA